MQRPFCTISAILAAGILFFLPLDAGKAACREPTMKILEEMRQIEFTQINYDDEADPYYGYIKGSIPVVISAPHGAKHFRTAEGVWKEADAYTSSLAIMLGRLTGAHVLFVKNKTGEDPNNDAGTEYKEALEEAVKENHIKFVLDLHGSASRRPFKIDVGIMHTSRSLCSCPSYRDIMEKIFAGFESPVFNQRFSACGEGTITCFARNRLGIEAAQIEINPHYRIVESKSTGFKADPRNVLDLVERLRRLIMAINEKMTETAPEAADSLSCLRLVRAMGGFGRVHKNGLFLFFSLFYPRRFTLLSMHLSPTVSEPLFMIPFSRKPFRRGVDDFA